MAKKRTNPASLAASAVPMTEPSARHNSYDRYVAWIHADVTGDVGDASVSQSLEYCTHATLLLRLERLVSRNERDLPALRAAVCSWIANANAGDSLRLSNEDTIVLALAGWGVQRQPFAHALRATRRVQVAYTLTALGAG